MPIFVLVMTVAIYCVVRFRAKPGDKGDGAPIHGNTRLEVVWVTIPFLIVSALAAYGWIVLDDIEAKKPNELDRERHRPAVRLALRVPGAEGKSRRPLVLPEDRPVDFGSSPTDVIHSFWVPEFRLKTDAVPGLTTKIRVTPTRLGTYEVVCAELCGLGHSTMRQRVRVMRAGRVRRLARRQASSEGGRLRGRRRAVRVEYLLPRMTATETRSERSRQQVRRARLVPGSAGAPGSGSLVAFGIVVGVRALYG